MQNPAAVQRLPAKSGGDICSNSPGNHMKSASVDNWYARNRICGQLVCAGRVGRDRKGETAYVAYIACIACIAYVVSCAQLARLVVAWCSIGIRVAGGDRKGETVGVRGGRDACSVADW